MKDCKIVRFNIAFTPNFIKTRQCAAEFLQLNRFSIFGILFVHARPPEEVLWLSLSRPIFRVFGGGV